MKTNNFTKKIFFSFTILFLSINFSFAQVNFQKNLSDRLDQILTIYGDGTKSQVKNARKVYVRNKEGDAAVVKGIQELLVKGKYLPETKSNGKSSIDGSFGNMTRDAVKKFQAAYNAQNPNNKIAVDGKIGVQTARAFNETMNKSGEAAQIRNEVAQNVSRDIVQVHPDGSEVQSYNPSTNQSGSDSNFNYNIADQNSVISANPFSAAKSPFSYYNSDGQGSNPENVASINDNKVKTLEFPGLSELPNYAAETASAFKESISDFSSKAAEKASDYYMAASKEISDYIKNFNNKDDLGGDNSSVADNGSGNTDTGLTTGAIDVGGDGENTLNGSDLSIDLSGQKPIIDSRESGSDEESGINGIDGDAELSKLGEPKLGGISRSPESSDLEKLKAGEEIYKRALANPALRREGETEKDLQAKLAQTREDIAKEEKKIADSEKDGSKETQEKDAGLYEKILNTKFKGTCSNKDKKPIPLGKKQVVAHSQTDGPATLNIIEDPKQEPESGAYTADDSRKRDPKEEEQYFYKEIDKDGKCVPITDEELKPKKIITDTTIYSKEQVKDADNVELPVANKN